MPCKCCLTNYHGALPPKKTIGQRDWSTIWGFQFSLQVYSSFSLALLQSWDTFSLIVERQEVACDSTPVLWCLVWNELKCLVAELLQASVLSALAGNRIKRTRWRASAVSYTWRKCGSCEVQVELPPPVAALLRHWASCICLAAILLVPSF